MQRRAEIAVASRRRIQVLEEMVDVRLVDLCGDEGDANQQRKTGRPRRQTLGHGR